MAHLAGVELGGLVDVDPARDAPHIERGHQAHFVLQRGKHTGEGILRTHDMSPCTYNFYK